jgi:hypothetical protein
MQKISLLTMGAGNVKVLRKTIESFSSICDEIVYGDMLLWEEDRVLLKSYQQEFNLKIVELPFNFIFENGFSYLLNTLSAKSTNDLCIYMNTSEIIGVDYGMAEIIKNNQDCNSFFFTHATEVHRWFRCYNKKDLEWSGLIHEELVGEYIPFHKPIFQMSDLEKDLDNEYKAKILNDCKEIVYWNQLCNLVENNSLLGATSSGWLEFAVSQYDSMKERLSAKGERYEAYKSGDLKGYLHEASISEEFKGLEFKSNNIIAYQGDKIHLL